MQSDFWAKNEKMSFFLKIKHLFPLFRQNKCWIHFKKVLKKMHKKCLLYFLADLWMLIIMFILKIVFCCATLANVSWQYTLKSLYKKVKGFPCILKNQKTWKTRHFPPNKQQKSTLLRNFLCVRKIKICPVVDEFYFKIDH